MEPPFTTWLMFKGKIWRKSKNRNHPNKTSNSLQQKTSNSLWFSGTGKSAGLGDAFLEFVFGNPPDFQCFDDVL